MKLDLKLTGIKEMQARLEKYGAEARAAANEFLWMEAHEVLTQAKQLAPLDMGSLRSSGVVDPPLPPPGTDRLPEITVGFGGPSAMYALIQHERTDFAHDEGQAKYLEQPFLARVGPDFFNRMGEYIAGKVK